MNLIDAAKEALKRLERFGFSFHERKEVADLLRKAIEDAEKNQFNPDWNAINLLSEENLALHKRIAELEAEKAEPFGYFNNPFLDGWQDCKETDEGAIALYEAPPQHEWDGLSAHEMSEIYQYNKLPYEILKATEAKLKEKNHIADAGKMVALEKENLDLRKCLEQTAMALQEQVELNKYLEKKCKHNTDVTTNN